LTGRKDSLHHRWDRSRDVCLRFARIAAVALKTAWRCARPARERREAPGIVPGERPLSTRTGRIPLPALRQSLPTRGAIWVSTVHTLTDPNRRSRNNLGNKLRKTERHSEPQNPTNIGLREWAVPHPSG
jgi:hypothetical protein